MNKNQVITLREKLDWSQQKLADYIGVDVGTVSRWERDKNQPTGAALKILERLDKREKNRDKTLIEKLE